MTKLDVAIERLKALPDEEKEAVAAEIELLLDSESVLTPEQWAEIEREIDSDDGAGRPHSEVMAMARARLGK